MANAKKKDDSDLLSVMRQRMASSTAAFATSRAIQLEDQKFAIGNSDNNYQWPEYAIETRRGSNGSVDRPTLTVNRLPQHIKQVTNDQRQNPPAGHVIPANDSANADVAQIFDGMIRYIESASEADIAYRTAGDGQVTHGEGYWRILTEYVDEDSFDQEIRIARIRNPFSVYDDPMIQHPCGKDRRFCFITDDMTHEAYEAAYPKATLASTLRDQHPGDPTKEWVTEKTIRVAEYFYVETTTRTLNLWADGSTTVAGSPQDKRTQLVYLTPRRTREAEVRQVKWIKTNGFEELERADWAGKYIPVVRVVGNEDEIEGELEVSGIVRNAKDAVRMVNYWTSQEAEMLALAPKAPFIGYAGQFAGHESKWKTANTHPWPYLEANPLATDGSGNPLPLPMRSQPPEAQVGLIQAKAGAVEDVKATTGQYNAALGMTSNERSGKAINARKMESDTGTYHYIDNLAKAVRFSTEIIIDLIPKIYDTRRVVQIIGIDDEAARVQIDPEQPEAVREQSDEMGNIQKIYNPSIGRYAVRVTTGPNFLTKRQEGAQAMTDIASANPALWATAGDLIAKYQDWPGADAFAERLRRTIDPKLLDKKDPQVGQLEQTVQQQGQMLDQMHQMLKAAQSSLEERELALEAYKVERKADSDDYNAVTNRLKVAPQDAITAEQAQDIVAGTMAAARDAGDLVAPKPVEPQGMPPQGNGGMPV